ncbi:hypothetical protein JTY60_02025 [symbiont of Argiope bruennichi]|uniref:hypothetical protein n=1 Tax=symbiont of Argiope bruennichi TaxID=2810479 RepID=UPI003DA50843
MVDEIKNVLLSTNNLNSYDYDDKEIDKINILLSKYEDKFFDISDFLSKTISISQKETIDKEINNLKESYDLVKNIINDLKQNSFAMSLFTDKIKDDVFQKINEIDLLLSEFPNDDLKTYSKKLESDNNFLIFLENTSSNIEEIVTETKNNFKKIFFEKLLEKIQKENFTNYFNENNINKFSAIEDLYEVFSEIYNLDILEDLVASNVFENNDLKKLNLANKIFDLLKTKNIKDYSDYKKNYINVNEFVNKITKIKENIDTNVYNEDLINFNLDKNDDFFHQKEKIILSLKKYQLNLIYEKNGISKKTFQDRFNYTNDEVDSLDFLLSKKSDLENIIKNLAGNKKNILQFKNLFLEKYEFFNNMFSSSFFVSNELNLDDPEFNNLSDLFNEIINIQENEYDLNFVTKYTNTSQKINFNKSEIDFENNDLKVLKKIVKNYFDYLFAEKIVEFTKVNINSFDAIIWDKVIQENNYLKQFYATWKSDNFTKDFLQKNNFDDFNTQNFVNFSSILRTLEAEYKKNTNFNILFEELIKDKKNLFFYLSKNEIKVNSKLLDNIKLNDYFFFENFQKDFQNSFNLKNFDSLKKYNNFSIENTNNFETLKDKIKEVFSWLLEKNILLAKNIFNNAIKDYEKFLSISKNFNFVNYFLTSHEKNRLEQIFNYFKKNSNLEYKNLEIINNISLYKSYFDNFNEDEIFNNKNNILALFDNSLDLEKYFLICAKGYLFFNSELIDQNKFNNFLQSNKNNYEIKDEYKNNYFDFDDPLYKNHLDNVDTKWNLKSIINIHDELFLQTDNFQKFYNNLKIITKLSNDDTSLNFSEKLEENNLIFKINFLKNEVDELNKTWNDFFDKFFNEYPVFNYNNVLNSLKDEKFNKIKNELKIENFSNLNRQEFIDKISIKIGELSLSEDKEKNELLNKSVINLKQKLLLDKEIKNLYSEKSNENYLNFYHLRNRLPSDFELNICILDINDLYLTEEELKQKYSSTSPSKFIFNDFSKKQKFFENFKKYLSFSEFRNIIFHRPKIYIDYYIDWSKIVSDNFSDFDFVLDYEAKLLEKYTNDQTIGANEKKVLIEYINEKVDQKLFLKLFSDLIKNKLQPIKFFKNDLNFLKKIDQNFSATEDDKSIKIIFFDENIDLLITKYQENKNLASSNPFSKTNIYKKISDYINFGTKNNILTSLEYLDTEVQKITKQSYYTDLYTNFLKQPNIFKSLSDDINNLYQKIAIDPNLKQTYKIVLDGTEHLLSSVNPRDFQNIAAIFFNKQKSLIFKEIILNYFNKYQNFFQYYEEFADFNENDDDEKTIKLFFDYFSANFSELSEDDKLNWILTNVENRNIENKFNIFDNYLTKIEKKSRFSFKEYIVNFLENIKKNSIVFDDAITANTNNFFDLENINIKSLKNINLDELNFDIGDFDSYINLKNIYNLLLKNHTEVDNINYNFSTLKATLKNLENLYLSSENKIIQKKILNIVSLYDKLNQNYKGFHYLSSDKFNLNEQKILDIFKNFKKEEKIYYLFNFSENGTEYQNFLKEQSDKLLSEKLSIIKEVKEQNFYGYNFDLDQANEWWYSKKPAYIDEVLEEKIKLGHNASQILKDKFLNQSIISDLKQLIKNNIVLKDLKNLFKEQEKIFLNFWYQDQNKVIENFSINLEKTEYLLENYSFNFYKIAKQFFNQIKEMQKEQVTIFNKYQELEKKSLVFKHSNQIIKVQNVEKTASGALLKKEQENVYSIENKKEKYFIIGINYGFLIVLKTTDFQNKLKDCIFTEKTVFDLHRLKKTSLNDANIFISDKKIVLEDKKNQKVLVSIEYEDLIENIKEDLLNFEANDFENIQNFYKTLKNQKIIIENNLYPNKIKETFYSTLDFDSDSKNLLWKIQNFYYREDNIWPVKNFVLYDVYNKNNVLVILFNNFDANSSKKEKEFIYKIELDKSIWYPEEAIKFFNNHNIEYLEKELSENLKKTAKITPYIVISVATLGIFSAFVILIKKFIKNQKIKKKFKNSKKN